MKDLLEFIVTKIVDQPEEVSISEEKNERFYYTNLRLKVHPDDMGKIIGKGGKTIRSIRLLTRLPAISQNRRVNIELVEPDANPDPDSLS